MRFLCTAQSSTGCDRDSKCAPSQDKAGVQTVHQHLVKSVEFLVKLPDPTVVVFCSINNKYLDILSTCVRGSGSGTGELKKWTKKSRNVWGPSIQGYSK